MNAARALRFARRRAGLSQTELARKAGVPPQVVNRIELAHRVPRVDTLDRLLAAADATLTVSRRPGAGIDRGPIRDLLEAPPRSRLGAYQLGALDELRRRGVRFVLVGDAAARLHGVPVESVMLDLALGPDHMNPRRLELARRSGAVSDLVKVVDAHYGSLLEEALDLPWLPPPRTRVMNRWLDAPKGFFASIEDLMRDAFGRRWELLAAAREEIDALAPGHRIYRPAE